MLKAAWAIKTRNAIILAPHPRTKKTNACVVDMMRSVLQELGLPGDLIQNVAEVSVQNSQELMASCDLILATGGGGMVKAAYSSGTPAYGVGAGNAVTIVDDTSDPERGCKQDHEREDLWTRRPVVLQRTRCWFRDTVYDDFLAAHGAQKAATSVLQSRRTFLRRRCGLTVIH